jgi:hypothetical protein
MFLYILPRSVYNKSKQFAVMNFQKLLVIVVFRARDMFKIQSRNVV